MRDPVAEVLRQRRALDGGPAAGLALSVFAHAGLTALAVWATLRAPTPRPVRMVNIQFTQAAASVAPVSAPARARPKPAPVQPAAAPPTPRLQDPKPEPPVTATASPEKGTVPLSPFGRSQKKGSESPETRPVPTTAAPAAATSAPGAVAAGVPAVEVPIGGSGVTGLEGGDFPYSMYIEAMQRKIGGNWFRPQVPPGTTVVIYFRIQRDGTITVDAPVAKSSGISTFDRAAVSAVRSSSPLNRLPPGYTGGYLGVHLTFR